MHWYNGRYTGAGVEKGSVFRLKEEKTVTRGMYAQAQEVQAQRHPKMVVQQQL